MSRRRTKSNGREEAQRERRRILRRYERRLYGWVTLALALALALAVACAGPGPAPTSVPARTLRERHAAVEIGQTPGEVASLLGSLPVRRPGHPDDPFSTPLHVAEWVSPSHERIRLEIYVVEAHPAAGCPDVQYDDAPVVFVDGRVAGTTWEFVEQHWRDWGGDLGRLRRLQDRFSCEPPPDPAA